MRFREFTSESKGIFGRKQGDSFINDNGVEASFQYAKMFPSEIVDDGYENLNLALKAVKALEKKLSNTIEWINKPTNSSKAFAIASLQDASGNNIYWGKWYTKVPGQLIKTWKNDAVPPGWSLNTKNALKSKSGLTPQDLVNSRSQFPNANKIIDMVAKNGASPEIINGLKMAANGKMPVFKNMAPKFEAVRDHIGEIVQPIALISGLIQGDAEKARSQILQAPWNKCQVFFPQGKNANLVDSEFVNPATGIKLGISSKGDKGANASVKNLHDAVLKAKSENNTKLLRTHKDAIAIITEFGEKSAKIGPLDLAVSMNIISTAARTEILKLMDIDKVDTSGLSKEAKYIFQSFGSRTNTKGYRTGYVLLANAAKLLADKINQDPKFGKSCLALLNQSNIIQIYSSAKVQGNDVVFTGFRSVFPPDFKGTILLDAGKYYTSAGPGGKMAFEIKKV